MSDQMIETKEELLEKIAQSIAASGDDINAARNAVRRFLIEIQRNDCIIVSERYWNAALAGIQSYCYGNTSKDLAEELFEGIKDKPLVSSETSLPPIVNDSKKIEATNHVKN